MKKINNIKQFLFVLLAFAFVGINQAWSYDASGSAVKQVGSTYYVLYDTKEYNFSTISSKEYTLQGPGAQVYYDAERVPILGFSGGDLKLAQKVDGSYGDALYSAEPPKNSYKSYGPVSIDRKATNIKLYTETGATGRKYMKNVYVTMAQYVDEASASSIAFGSGYVNAANTSKSVTVAWCNVPAMTYSIVGADKDKFSVSVSNNASAGKWGTATFTVAYKHTAAGNHNAKLVIADTYNSYSYEVSLSGTTQKTPNSITWNADEATWKDWNETLDLNATAKNTDYTNTPIVYTSGNNDYASIADGVVTFHEAGAGKEITVTATQDETDAYLGASATKTFHILNAQTITWDPTVVNTTLRLGTTRDISAYTIATPEGSRAITYSSSDPSVIEVHEDGVTIEGKSIGTAVLTATLAGDGQYRQATTTKEFEVKEKEVAVVSLGELILNENEEVNIYIGENSGALSSTNTASALSCEITDESVVSYNAETHQFESLQLGSTTVVISQEGNDEYPAVNRTITINVIRYQTVITASLEEATLFVGEDAAVQFASNRENDEIAVESSNADVAIYQEGKIVAVGEGTANIIFSQAETDTWSAAEKKVFVTVNRRAASLSVKINGVSQTSISIYQGESVPVTFDKVSDAEVAVEQIGGQAFASYSNGSLKATNEIGTAYFRAVLPQTQQYSSATVEFSVTVLKDARHLPITMNSSLWSNSNFVVSTEGTTSWDNSKGITLGATDGATNWDDKSVILHFEGIPDKLTFDIATDATGAGSWFGGATNVEWYIQESTSKTMSGDKIWTQSADGTDFTSYTVQLDPSTRYVKLCYSGNFGGHFRNVKISELKYVQDPTPATINFGKAVINSGEVSKTTTVNWCNVAPMTVTCDNPRFTVTPATFGDYEQMNSEELTISYTHGSEVGLNEATITITNGDEQYDKIIHVSAETTKRPQTIMWHAELVATNYAMNVGEQYPDDAISYVATTPSAGKVILTSSNSDIIEVIADTALLAKADGKAKIFAYQAGDAEYEEVTDSVEFTVTTLQKQTITWNQNLFGLLTTSAPVELTATATSGMDITYTSANEAVVRIEGNMLIVAGEGETTITAKQTGGVDSTGVEWLEISQVNYVIVRNPASQCNGMSLSVSSLTLTHTNSFVKEYALEGTPTTLTFSAKHGTKPNGDWGQSPTYAALMVDEYTKIDGVWGWNNIYNKVVGTSETTPENPLVLDSIATKVRFRTSETGTDHTITNIRVSRKKFMTSDVEVLNLDVESNAIWEKTITVSHSNIDLMTVTAKQGLLNLSTSTLGGGCGSYGDDAFVASFTPMQKYVDYYDTIVITDGKDQPSTIEIPVHLYSKGLNQAIEGFVVPETAKTTDEIAPFHATATSLLPITYGTSDTTIARIVNDSVLEIVTAGTVEIYAIQAGNEKYDSTAVAKTLVVSKVAATIQTLPQVAEITYGQTLAEATLTDGAGSVEGTFAWADATIVPEAGEHAYMVVFTPANEAWYEGASEQLTVSVAKVDAAVETAPIAVANLAYTGEPQVLIEAGQAAGGTLLYSLDGENYADTLPTGVEVGEYTIYYMVAGDANHNDVPAATVTAVISGDDAVLLVAPVAFDTLVYTGEPQVLIEAGEAQGGTLLYSLGDIDHFADTLPTAVEVGEYKIYYYVAGDENHSNTLLDSLSVAIAPEEPVLTPQTITWEWDADNDTIEVEDQVYIDVYATSNLEVTITISDETKAVLMDNWLNALAAGTITVTATQDGNDVWAAAEPVVHQITIIDPNAQTEPDPQITTAVDELEAKSAVTKIIRDNQVLIIRDNRTYTATGLLVE